MTLKELFDMVNDIAPFLIIGGLCIMGLSGMIALLVWIWGSPLLMIGWVGLLILLVGFAIMVIEDCN